jgi:hypothetical protein
VEQLAVFVHVIGPNGRRFQDDHMLLDGIDTSFQPFPEVFTENRRVSVPADLPPGEYRLWVGLYQTVPPRRRLEPTTDLNGHERAVEIPLTLRITAR